MFYFESIPLHNWLMWFAVLAILLGLNEIIRYSKWGSLALFIALPFVLTPIWFSMESEITSWFTWVKVYSALAGSIIFMVIRFTNFHKKHKWYLMLPPAILGLNILEACIREFQVGYAQFNGIVDGMQYISGGWNYFNAIAGILNILLMCGWFGIYASKGKRKDMIWPDQIRLWVIAYGFWNISYVYSCAPGNSFYSGFALNIAATIPALLWAKGAWLQHRAATLSFWMMWVMTFPYFFAVGSHFNVAPSYNPAANWSIALISFGLNVGLAIWQVYRIFNRKINPYKSELYTDLPEYIRVSNK